MFKWTTIDNGRDRINGRKNISLSSASKMEDLLFISKILISLALRFVGPSRLDEIMVSQRKHDFLLAWRTGLSIRFSDCHFVKSC